MGKSPGEKEEEMEERNLQKARMNLLALIITAAGLILAGFLWFAGWPELAVLEALITTFVALIIAVIGS